MRALIISGGSPPSLNLIKNYYKERYIIAADSGCDVLFKYKLKPDLIMGDLDSIDEYVLKEYLNNGIELTKFPSHKDYSDTELSVMEAIKRGADDITILGATGGRTDHLLANLNLLYLMNQKGINGRISDENNEIYLIESPAEIEGKIGEYFSIFSLGKDVKEITLTNCKYPLDKYHLNPRDSLILSNEFSEGNLKIKFDGGPLIFIKSWD